MFDLFKKPFQQVVSYFTAKYENNIKEFNAKDGKVKKQLTLIHMETTLPPLKSIVIDSYNKHFRLDQDHPHHVARMRISFPSAATKAAFYNQCTAEMKTIFDLFKEKEEKSDTLAGIHHLHFYTNDPAVAQHFFHCVNKYDAFDDDAKQVISTSLSLMTDQNSLELTDEALKNHAAISKNLNTTQYRNRTYGTFGH